MGVGMREALGVRRLAAALFLCLNNVPVPISAPTPRGDQRRSEPTTCLSPYFPAPPRMQRALAGAKRLECGSLLPLCLMHKQRVCPHIAPFDP
ncbi:MAG: hypothetical protein GX456_04795, partial [Verrucomicrobia bacterium]|nr:hypothetical protein [Verrucomicrobiota bacterium]